MTFPDAIFRYHPQPGPEIHLDIGIYHTCLTTQQKTSFQGAIATDPDIRALSQMIINRWPEDASDVLKNLRKYFSYASTLTVEDGFILRGEALLILESKWAQVLQHLHDGQ